RNFKPGRLRWGYPRMAVRRRLPRAFWRTGTRFLAEHGLQPFFGEHSVYGQLAIVVADDVAFAERDTFLQGTLANLDDACFLCWCPFWHVVHPFSGGII